ncbi:2OG-Fe(II) oxygenase [Rhodoblastus acidophilus]|uniref:2OG-Fe(II) oxygenase n=1 Tax=Candidatus Rhodoblastus alkanivorans TaxID=2954117 RepID=A0ABS9Z9T3_9HYPH|nr:2OG-Fe(II) oxygenase [Candidatus Rhodoblastus alkanivorans]MCI4677041.1 2OG-Fe(II) oxygenase [Candidatus Rhodoblastus alkanivorans]MCI4684394.1 2OG-Fe(II) oxygenase [Candidatus Rhodoblastus alkanivorans]MDI4641715.1 2OG-Fe(II) oxygenase [Rhodoblastus acidophilus]
MAQPSLKIGDPAPWFAAAAGADRGPVAFDELAGRFILLFFFSSAGAPDIAAALSSLDSKAEIFDGRRSQFVGVSNDPNDFASGRLPGRAGQVYFLDASAAAAARYGIAATPASPFRPIAFLLSPALQILNIIPFERADDFVRRSTLLLGAALAEPAAEQNAPILVVPHVFDRDLCRRLIELYDANGGREIGLIENKGQIVERTDTAYRKRLDYYVADDGALQRCRESLERRLLPLVYRAFQFPTTRIERYLVGCYDATTGGYFGAHRDNTAPSVAHRRFALTLPLNDEYEGGRLRFPEYGAREFTAAPGDAIVFSCALLHEVTPVTAGRRYAFISFFYDELGQRMRDAYAKDAAAKQTVKG